MRRISISLAGFIVLFGLMAAPVHSRAAASRISQAKPDAKTFTGIILKSGDTFVLSDPATKAKYMIDTQEKARPYEGKMVKITGTIDAAANLIHIETIQEVV